MARLIVIGKLQRLLTRCQGRWVTKVGTEAMSKPPGPRTTSFLGASDAGQHYHDSARVRVPRMPQQAFDKRTMPEALPPTAQGETTHAHNGGHPVQRRTANLPTVREHVHRQDILNSKMLFSRV